MTGFIKNLSRIDAWLLARVIEGYDVPTHQLRQGSADVANLVRYASGLNFRDRRYAVQQAVGIDQMPQINAIDPEQLISSFIEDVPDSVDVMAQGRAWYMMHASDLEKLPDMQWLFPGEIAENSIAVLYAQPGAGKSFVALDYALQLAQTDPVVYVASEGELGYKGRVAAWCQYHQKQPHKLYFVIGTVSMMDATDLEQFSKAAASVSPRLIVIDTMADSMLGADENSTRDVGVYIENVKQVRRATGAALLLIHHTNKGGIKERGNIRIRASADTVMRLTPVDDVLTLESQKTKDSRLAPTRYLRLITVNVQRQDGTHEEAVVVPAEKVVDVVGQPLTNKQAKILEALSDGLSLSLTDLEAATEIGRGECQKIMARMKKLQLLQQAVPGTPYTITEQGMKALTAHRGDSPTPVTPVGTDNPATPESGESGESGESPTLFDMTTVPERKVHQYMTGR